MDGDSAAYALSYETGLRTLDQQMATIQDTRDRAGKLLTAATFAASLFLKELRRETFQKCIASLQSGWVTKQIQTGRYSKESY